jgi:hypothetical protein
MYLSQRAMSCCLYKYRSQPIDVSPTIESIQFTFILVLPYISSFLSFRQLDLVSATSTHWVAMVLAYHSSRHRLAGGEAPSSSASDASDYRRNRQKWIIQFAKPDSLVSAVLARDFRLCPIRVASICSICFAICT